MPAVPPESHRLEILVGALVALDSDAFSDLAVAAAAEAEGDAVASPPLGLLVAAQRQVDRMYREGEVDGACRAAAAAIVRRCIARCSKRARRSDEEGVGLPRRVAVSCPPSDSDLVEAEAAGELLAGEGWKVDLLAGKVRAEELSRHLATRRIVALVVAHARTSSLPGAAAAVRASHRAGVPVLALGPAFGTDEMRASRVGADRWFDNLAGIVETASAWRENRPVVPPAAGFPADYRLFDAARPSVLAEATVHVDGTEPAAAWVRSAAEALLDHLGAAVLVDDNRVLLDHLDFELKGMQRHQLLEVHILGLVDAVARCVPAGADMTARFVTEAREHVRRALTTTPVAAHRGRDGVLLAVPSVLPARALPSERPAPLLGAFGHRRRSASAANAPAREIVPSRPASPAAGPASPGPSTTSDSFSAGIPSPATASPSQGATLPGSDDPPTQATRLGIAGAAQTSDPLSSGQVFADLLALVAFACQAPVSVLSARRASGEWTTLAHGGDSKSTLNDFRFFEVVAASDEPTEIADMSRHPDLVASPLMAAPLALRWAYGVPLRDPYGEVIGVLAVLDRWLRQLTRREQRAMQAASRQVVAHLLQWRRPGVSVRPKPAPARPSSASGQPRRPGVVGLNRPGYPGEPPSLLRSHEVAVLFDVTERTVINWAAASKLPSLRTVGGHLRFRREDVLALLSGRSSGTAS